MRKQIVYLAAFLIWLGGCASDTTEKPASLTPFEHEVEIAVVWESNTGPGWNEEDGIKLHPWFSSTTIFVASENGKLVALDKETGKEKWRVDAGMELSAGVGGGSSMVFVGSADGQLAAFWQTNGKKVWQIDLGAEVLAPAVAERGFVVVRTTDGNLQGISAGTGEKLWAYRFTVPSLSLRGTATPVIYAGGVICGGDDGRLSVVRLDTGQLLWDQPVSVSSGASELARVIDIDMPAVVDDGMVFVGAYQGRVAAIEAKNGRVNWAREKSVYLPLAVDDYNVYVVDNRSFVWALNRYSGSTVWEQEALRARPSSGAAVYKNMLILGDFEGVLHVLDTSDGRLVGRKILKRVNKHVIGQKLPDRESRYDISMSSIKVQPYVDGDYIYVINNAGDLYALQIKPLEKPE